MAFEPRFALIGAGLLWLFAPAWGADIQTYSWRDAQGVVHYSNLLSQQAIARGYEVLNGEGEVIEKVPPPLTPAQRAAQEAKARERAREQAALEAQARHDRLLLKSFTSVQELERLRDERLQAIDARLRHLRDSRSSLEAHLRALRQETAKAAAEKTPPPDAAQRQQSLLTRLQQINTAIAQLRSERRATAEQFAADISRFRQLKAEDRAPRQAGAQ